MLPGVTPSCILPACGELLIMPVLFFSRSSSRLMMVSPKEQLCISCRSPRPCGMAGREGLRNLSPVVRKAAI